MSGDNTLYFYIYDDDVNDDDDDDARYDGIYLKFDFLPVDVNDFVLKTNTRAWTNERISYVCHGGT